MLDFPDLPYRYFPPRPSLLAGAVIRQVNRWRHLPRTLQIRHLTVRGREHLAPLRPDDALLLVPNHPTHADAAILVEACRQLGLTPRIMAAYDVFLRGRLDAWVMQRLGCFSVNRDASDPQALAEAERSLVDHPRRLVIFAEGNVYLRNDRVGAFQEGAALLALRSARAMQKAAGNTRSRRVVVLPVAIKASHTSDIRPAGRRILGDLAAALGVPLISGTSPQEAVRQVAVAALHRNLAQRGRDRPQTTDLRALIDASAEAVLAPLEAKLGLSPRPRESIEDRVRAARRAVHEVRADPARVIDHAAALAWADEAMLALRIASYAPDYVAEHPTCDRVAETIEKLWEDLYRKPHPPIGPRHAWLTLGEPIPVDEALLGPQIKTRAAITQLTSQVERTIQKELDTIWPETQALGGQRWGEHF